MEAAEVNMLSFSVTGTRVDGIRDKDVREDRQWRFMDAVKENKRSGD